VQPGLRRRRAGRCAGSHRERLDTRRRCVSHFLLPSPILSCCFFVSCSRRHAAEMSCVGPRSRRCWHAGREHGCRRVCIPYVLLSHSSCSLTLAQHWTCSTIHLLQKQQQQCSLKKAAITGHRGCLSEMHHQPPLLRTRSLPQPATHHRAARWSQSAAPMAACICWRRRRPVYGASEPVTCKGALVGAIVLTAWLRSAQRRRGC
jgi:hypothetical protein